MKGICVFVGGLDDFLEMVIGWMDLLWRKVAEIFFFNMQKVTLITLTVELHL